jgi:magnesium and cobalt transporter
VDERTWRVAAKMAIGDFNTVTGLSVPDEHFDTVGGWVLDLFGRVPHRGESVEADGVRVTVETMHRNRILQVLVRLAASPSAHTAALDGSASRDAAPRSGSEA